MGNSYFSRTKKKEWLYIVLLDALKSSVKTEKMVQDLTTEELNTNNAVNISFQKLDAVF